MGKDFHICSKEGCEAKCSKEFCRHHLVKYNQCAYVGCIRRCRKVYCKRHNPVSMQKTRERNHRRAIASAPSPVQV
jgi:hypothetical protein